MMYIYVCVPAGELVDDHGHLVGRQHDFLFNSIGQHLRGQYRYI